MKTDVPHPIYLKDYAPPSFLVDETVLEFALAPAETRVRSRLSMRPEPGFESQVRRAEARRGDAEAHPRRG